MPSGPPTLILLCGQFAVYHLSLIKIGQYCGCVERRLQVSYLNAERHTGIKNCVMNNSILFLEPDILQLRCTKITLVIVIAIGSKPMHALLVAIDSYSSLVFQPIDFAPQITPRSNVYIYSPQQQARGPSSSDLGPVAEAAAFLSSLQKVGFYTPAFTFYTAKQVSYLPFCSLQTARHRYPVRGLLWR